MVKRWLRGTLLMVAAVLLVYISGKVILEMDLLMFNPKNRGMMFAGIVWFPLFLYEIVYGVWFLRCAKKGKWNYTIYKGTGFLLIFTAIIYLAAIVWSFSQMGFLSEAILFVMISFIITTMAFGYSLLRIRPF